MKSNTLKKTTPAATALLIPTIVAAFINNEPILELIIAARRVVGQTVPILVGLALIVFIWGVVKFMTADEDRARSAGKRHIVWGVVGLFVIVSVWGLVTLLGTLFGVRGETTSSPQSYFDSAPLSSESNVLPPCPRCCCNRTSPECIGATYSCSACSLSCN